QPASAVVSASAGAESEVAASSGDGVPVSTTFTAEASLASCPPGPASGDDSVVCDPVAASSSAHPRQTHAATNGERTITTLPNHPRFRMKRSWCKQDTTELGWCFAWFGPPRRLVRRNMCPHPRDTPRLDRVSRLSRGKLEGGSRSTQR